MSLLPSIKTHELKNWPCNGRPLLSGWRVTKPELIESAGGLGRIQLHGDPQAYQSPIELVAKELQELTGLSITLVDNGGNLHIRMADKMPARFITRFGADQAACGGSMRFGSDYIIDAGEVYIPLSLHPITIRECFAEETLQVISGMGNDSDEVFKPRESIFRNSDGARRPTDIDKVLIRAQFEPRIRLGMSRLEARPVIRQVIADLL